MIIRNLKTLALCSVVALSFGVSAANAQNVETLNAEITVLNDITITENQVLQFGNIGLRTFAGQTPTIVVDAAGGRTETSVGGVGNAQIILFADGVEAAAEIALVAAAGAAVSGVTINMEIDAVTNLIGPGPDEFTLSDFVYDDGTNSGAVALATPVNVLLDANGEAIVNIGATATVADAGDYADGTYVGTYEMTVYY